MLRSERRRIKYPSSTWPATSKPELHEPTNLFFTSTGVPTAKAEVAEDGHLISKSLEAAEE